MVKECFDISETPLESSDLNSKELPMLPYVISTRIRLARNVRGFRFPHAAPEAEQRAVSDHIIHAVRHHPHFSQAQCLSLDKIAPLERKILAEQHVISHLASSASPLHRWAILSAEGNASALINEEDHVRIQAVLPGFQLPEAWHAAASLDSSFRETLDFAVSGQNGYLTTCPTNAGTGLRASIMLFVPGLVYQKRLFALMRDCSAHGYTIRGNYGEGSLSQGYTLQLSYQNSREKKVSTILDRLHAVCMHIIHLESESRTALMRNSSSGFHQKIEKNIQRLLAAKQLDIYVARKILAMLRLKEAPGLSEVSRASVQKFVLLIDRLAIQIQPAHIRRYAMRRQASDSLNEEKVRTEFLRNMLLHHA